KTYLFAFLLTSCLAQNAAEASSVKCQDLLIDVGVFQANWSAGHYFEAAPYYGAVEQCAINFYVLNGNAGQIVYRYKNKARAERGYRHMLESLPTNESDFLLDTSPTVFRFSTVADETHLSCYSRNSISICRALARYGTDVVSFNTYVGPSFMNRDEFGEILHAIDKRMLDNLRSQED